MQASFPDCAAELDEARDEELEHSRPHPRLPLPLTLALLFVFLPEGFSFFVAGLRLTLVRLLFIVITPLVFARLAARIGSGQYRFVAADLFVVLTGLWMFIAPAVTTSVSNSLVHSGPVVLEYLVAYFATRVLLSDDGQALSFASLFCLVVSCVVIDALMDTLTGRYFTREIVEQVTGYHKMWSAADEYRFGLLRAAGPIEHPILFGFVCGLSLLLASAVKIRARAFCIVMSVLGVAISFSSAPEQSTIMGLGLLVYSRVFASVSRRWLLLWTPAVIGAIALFEATPTPFGHLFDLITIDPQTAYYRLYIWSAVGPAILDQPLFGVLGETIDYEGSVDSVWLMLSLLYGMPGAILAGLSMIGACSLPAEAPRAGLSREEARLGTALGIVIFLVIFMGFTVHFWGSVWILIGLLMGVRAHLGDLGRRNRARNAKLVAILPESSNDIEGAEYGPVDPRRPLEPFELADQRNY